jgi:hypothetical protein
MIVYKAFLGQSDTSDSIRKLQASSELEEIDSWSEASFTYEKYNTEDVQRNWDKILRTSNGLQSLDKVPLEGSWGILYDKQ